MGPYFHRRVFFVMIEGNCFSYLHSWLDIPSLEGPLDWFACFDPIDLLGFVLFVMVWVVWP